MSSEWLLHSSTEHIKQTLAHEPAPQWAESRGVSPATGTGRGKQHTCLIGMARPLPMLSARLSRPFFSLSGSLPFRDCKVKIKLAFAEGLRFTDRGGEPPSAWFLQNTRPEALDELCVYPRAHTQPRSRLLGRPSPPSHDVTGSFLNFSSSFSTAKLSFNSFVKSSKFNY